MALGKQGRGGLLKISLVAAPNQGQLGREAHASKQISWSQVPPHVLQQGHSLSKSLGHLTLHISSSYDGQETTQNIKHIASILLASSSLENTMIHDHACPSAPFPTFFSLPSPRGTGLAPISPFLFSLGFQ